MSDTRDQNTERASSGRHHALAKAVRATSLMTLASRLGGLVRDVMLGRIFGDGPVNSAFAAAFAVPNMFRRLFGEGALSAAFIPEYTDAARKDPREAGALATLTMAALGLVAGGLTVVIELALLVVLLVAPGDAERELSIKLMMVMLPFMPMICMVAILAGMLQVHGRYAAAASGPVVLNAFIIATGVYFVFTGTRGDPAVAYALGAATVLSGVTQLLFFLRLLRGQVRWTRAWGVVRERGTRMLKKFGPVAIGLGTLQFNTLLDTVIAMWPIWVGPTMFGKTVTLDGSSNGILALTSRLYQFPLGVFGIAVATAAFPLLARHAKEPEAFADTLRRGLRIALFVGVPATIGLVLVRHDITAVMYGHGKSGWSLASLERSAMVLAGFSTGIWAYSINQVFTRAFYAQGDTMTPMRISLAMIGINVALNLTLIWPLKEAGLAWATSISAILQSVVLWVLCTRLLRRVGTGLALVDQHVLRGVLKIVIAAMVMGGLVYALLVFMPTRTPISASGWPGSTWLWQFARLGLATIGGGVAYLLLCRVLKISELSWVLHRGARAQSAGDDVSD